MNYRLGSLHLGTDFDRPVEPMPLPGVADRGDTPSLVLLDGASRAPHRLLRVVRSAALLGIQVERPTTAVRVRVWLLVDDLSTDMWRAAHAEETVGLRNEERHHRLLRLSVQGRTRAAVLLDRRATDGELSAQRVSMVLGVDEIGDSGLLTVAMDVPEDPPGWLCTGLLPSGLAGICVSRVGVTPLPDGGGQPGISTGRVPENGRHLVPRSPGALVVNPGRSHGPVVLQLLPRVLAPRPRPRGRRAVVKEPLARARDAVVRTTRTGPGHPVEVEVVPVDGGPSQTSLVQPRSDGVYLVHIAHGLLPAYVRPRPPGPQDGRGPRLDWYATVSQQEQ